MTQLLKDHFVLIYGSAVVGFILLLILAVLLFREILNSPEKVRKALRIEAGFVERIFAIARRTPPPPPEADPLAETSMPFKAVADPRTSGEKKP